ncbi:hypothetical protein [Zoogloea sp.]|uniref:hypothetical protein n=1 Tax=Zoogloea sp. TaxID=49181 RepID=UPI00141588A7|nr:MAG: hypothetical protein F9K15_08660 [Zoogloea sp.]
MPVLAPVALALAAFALLLFSHHTLESAQGQRDAARAALAGATAEVSRTEDLLRRDQLVQAQLSRLQQQGLDRPVDELRWHEALGRARQDLHLSALHYELPTERPAVPAASSTSSSLRAATLRFDAVLRHEEDFLALLQRLEHVGTGVFTRRCRLALAQNGEAPARLNAHCELERVYIRREERNTVQTDTGADAPPASGGTPLRQDQER